MIYLIFSVLAISAVIYIYYISVQRKIKKEAGELMKKVMVAWAAQGPFQTGSESARAMRYGFLAVAGLEKTKSYEKFIDGHEISFNANPTHWNELILIQNTTSQKEKDEILERLRLLLSSSKISDDDLGQIRDSIFIDTELPKLAGYLLKIKDRKSVDIYDERRIAFHGLSWSENSGAHELHLKRRVNNPLFPKERRLITQADIDAAVSMDTIETIELDEQKNNLIDKFSMTGNEIQLRDINEFREEVEDLIIRSDQIGKKADSIKESLEELRKILMDSWINSYPLDSADRQKLIDLENQRSSNIHSRYTENTLSRQISRGDVIPSDEILLSIISDDPDHLKYVYEEADDEFKNKIRIQTLETVRDAIDEGYPEEKAQRIFNVFN